MSSNVAIFSLAPAMPRVQEGSFPSEAHGGVRIHTKAWLPDGLGADRLRDKVASPPSAVVLWSHGLHEHLGRFEKLHEALVAKNVAVYAWDHVGHGESGSFGEKRHQFPRGFDAVVADGLQFARCEALPSRVRVEGAFSSSRASKNPSRRRRRTRVFAFSACFAKKLGVHSHTRHRNALRHSLPKSDWCARNTPSPPPSPCSWEA